VIHHLCRSALFFLSFSLPPLPPTLSCPAVLARSDRLRALSAPLSLSLSLSLTLSFSLSLSSALLTSALVTRTLTPRLSTFSWNCVEFTAPPLHNRRHVRDARAVFAVLVAGQRPPNGRSRSKNRSAPRARRMRGRGEPAHEANQSSKREIFVSFRGDPEAIARSLGALVTRRAIATFIQPRGMSVPLGHSGFFPHTREASADEPR